MNYPPRSYLFVPGDQEARVAKAFDAGADAVILDLEDSVAISQKLAARTHVGKVLDERVAADIFVRVNASGTPWHDEDVRAVVRQGLRCLILPKAESAGAVRDLDHLISEAERALARQIGSVELMVLIETSAGILHAEEIAAANPRVAYVAFGAYDFARDVDMRLTPTREELLVPRMAVVLAARAARHTPIDTVFADIRDTDGFEEDCRVARKLGFAGKMCIHPNQIAAVHKHFSPSKAEFDEAVKLLEAFDRAEAAGTAAIAVDGKLVDYPIVAQKRALVALGRVLGLG